MKRTVKIESGTGKVGRFQFRPFPKYREIGVKFNDQPERRKDPRELLEGLADFVEHYPGEEAEQFSKAIADCIREIHESNNRY